VGATQGDTYELLKRHLSWPITLIVLAGLAALVGSLETSRKIRQLEHQAHETSVLEARAHAAEMALIETICDQLKGLLASLGLYSEGRASIFTPRRDYFLLAGRYSPMPKYRQSVGRSSYPLSAGILGKAWDDGEADDPELPDPGSVNKPPTRGWLRCQARHGIEEAVACQFTMRSRAYAAIRLDDERHSLGVLMVETQIPAAQTAICKATGDKRGGSMDALRALASSNEVRTLCQLLNHLREFDDGLLRSCVVEHLANR
jgi:hypothetical protein